MMDIEIFLDDGDRSIAGLRAPSPPRTGDGVIIGGVNYRVESVDWLFLNGDFFGIAVKVTATSKGEAQ